MLNRLSRSCLRWAHRAPRLLTVALLVTTLTVAGAAFVLLRRDAAPTTQEPASALEPASADPVRSCDAGALDAAFRALDEASGYRFRSYHEVSENGQVRTATLSGAYRARKRMHVTVTEVHGGPPYIGYLRMVRLDTSAWVVPVGQGLQTWKETEAFGMEIPVRAFRGTIRAIPGLEFDDRNIGDDEGMCHLSASTVDDGGGSQEYRAVIDRQSGLLVEGAMEVRNVLPASRTRWGFTITWELPALEEFVRPVVIAP